MKAAYLTGVRQVEVRRAPDPTIERPGDVLLRIEVVGVCGSDMHYYRTGRIGTQVVEFPWIIGHECAATVVEAGADVANVRPGDRVAVDPCVTCGRCDQCAAGRAHTCRNQSFMGCPGQVAGALAELAVMPAECCYPLPEDVTAVQGALVEPLSVSLYASRLAGETAGASIGILGSGPIGLCLLKAIRADGPAKVYMTDIRDYRAEQAGRCGADWTGNPVNEDVVGSILALEPLGLDFVFECAGEQETLDQGVELLKPGGTLLLVGIPEFDRAGFDMEPLRQKEITIRNVRRQNECVAPAIEMQAAGSVELDELVTHHFSLDETPRAFETVADYRDGVVKAMIHL